MNSSTTVKTFNKAADWIIGALMFACAGAATLSVAAAGAPATALVCGIALTVLAGAYFGLKYANSKRAALQGEAERPPAPQV